MQTKLRDTGTEETGGLRTLPRRQVLITLVGVMLAMFLSSLDQTIVGTAMPRIVADLGGFSQYTWITTAYLIASTVVVPITGKLTDIYGRKWFYTAGLGIFVLGSLFCGLSQTMTQIIAARGFQGIGAGVMMANAFTVIGDLFPPAERGKYQGMISGVFAISAIIGPSLGGFITDQLSWHWVFFINIPLGIGIILLFIFAFPNFRPDRLKHHIDWAGTAALVTAAVAVMLALSWGGVEYPWSSAPIVGLFGLSAASGALFIFIEKRSPEPLIPLDLFRNPIVSASMAIVFLTGFGMFGAMIFVPLFFQGVLGLSATASGNFLMPMMLGVVASSFLSGQILSRRGNYRLLGFIGLGIMALGMVLLSRLSTNTGYAEAVLYIVVLGFGLGVALPLYTIIVQNAVPYNVMGVVTSSTAFFRSIGASFGLAILGSVMTNRFFSGFVDNLSPAVRGLIPPNLLSSISDSPQALVDPQAQQQLQGLFSGLGAQGAVYFEQVVTALREALSSAISGVFLIGLVVALVSIGVQFFVKEIPLRKYRRLSGDGEATENGTPPVA